MLEKARMKGKKTVTTQPPPANGEEFDDDGLCCTCGQNVGQHSHVPPPSATVAQSKDPGKVK
jgi:hypothetical protein